VSVFPHDLAHHLLQGFDLSLLEYLAYVAKAPNALVSILGNHLEDVLAFVLHVLQSPSVTFEAAAANLKRKKSPAVCRFPVWAYTS
jgi:hypothetical protein